MQEEDTAKVAADAADGVAMVGDDPAAEPLSIDITTSTGGGPLQPIQPHPGAPRDPSEAAQEVETQLDTEHGQRVEEQVNEVAKD